MKLLDLTLPTPAENLACDEALLEHAEATGSDEALRFWESPTYFVVVGYANRVATEVNVDACRAADIPILRRCTGGGTVVQGPGCLNYALVIKSPSESVTETNRYIMERHRDALNRCSGASVKRRAVSDPGGSQSRRYNDIQFDGHTDLSIGGRKFSGNAQRRKRRYVLFHGSFLHNFNLNLITQLLPMPSKQPAYRQSRSHRDFLMNLPLSPAEIKEVLTGVWKPTGTANVPEEIAREKYASAEWTFKF